MTAPIWMVLGAIVAAVAGVIGYLVLGAGFRALRGPIPEPVEVVVYGLYVAVPLFVALVVLAGISSALLSEQRDERPGLARHLWHCIFFYPLVLWTAYVIVDCRGAGTTPAVPARCADPLGISMALGLASLGAILADAWVVYRRRRSAVLDLVHPRNS